MIEIYKTKVIHNGNKYTLTPLKHSINVSENNDTDYATEISCKIEGFEEDIYVVFEETGEDEIGFSFGYFLGDTGLFVSLHDKDVIDIATELVFTALEE